MWHMTSVMWQIKKIHLPRDTWHMTQGSWNVHPPPCVTCHVSLIRCHMYFLFIFFLIGMGDKVVKLIGGGSDSNGAIPSNVVRTWFLFPLHSTIHIVHMSVCLWYHKTHKSRGWKKSWSNIIAPTCYCGDTDVVFFVVLVNLIWILDFLSKQITVTLSQFTTNI